MLYRQLWAKSYPEDLNRFHPLWCHLLDVAAVCQALLPRFGGIADLPDEWLTYLAALHDIGKADARFQGKAPGLVVPGVPIDAEGECRGFRHEARSAEWIASHLKAEDHGWGREAAHIISQATRGHHGDFQAEAYIESEWPWASFYALARCQLATLVAETLGIQPFAQKRFSNASVAGMKLSGLIVLSDWIASNLETYDYSALYSQTKPTKTPADYWKDAQAEAGWAVRRLQLDVLSRGSSPRKQLFTTVWPDCRNLRPSQKALEDAVSSNELAPGLAIIEAPMGEGKTEAAIYLASCWNRSGAYIALPTQATSNQMHGRYKAFLNRTAPDRAPRLVHGMAWLLDDESPELTSQTWGADQNERLLSREWFANAKRALLATDGVGTVDQVLMAALSVKHGFLRFLGLTTKTLIIDEVHAYDAYMTTLMKTLLQWCYALEIPVILLSATLSHAQKRELAAAYAPPGADGSLPMLSEDPVDEPYPLLTFIPYGGEAFVKETEASSEAKPPLQLCRHHGALDDPAQVAQIAREAVVNGGCACIIANTVRSAQKIFQELQNHYPDHMNDHTGDVNNCPDDVNDHPDDMILMLFHARFRAERRQELEKEVIRLFGKAEGGGRNENRPRRAILVATQVVEQSLDIDFDVMLSEIAPIDLLLQRSGRMHRHAENTPRPTGPGSVLHVLLSPAGGEPSFGGMEIKPNKDRTVWRGVYDRAALLRTLALLESRDAIYLPQDFRPLIEGCYGNASLPVSSVLTEWITEAEKLRGARRQGSESKAREHLIAEPHPKVFKYAQKTEQAVGEGEEGERASFFRAQTREGDDSRAAIILHDPGLVEIVREGIRKEHLPRQQSGDKLNHQSGDKQKSGGGQEWRPGKRRLKEIFLQKASLPAYWLNGTTAAEGYEMLTDVPKRLRYHVILIMQQGVWKGVQTKRNDKTGEVTITRITITDSPTLGLSWTGEKETDASDI